MVIKYLRKVSSIDFMEDIDIIVKQTGLEKDLIQNIYNKNNNDIVSTICELEGFVENPKKEPELTETQQKIKEFREIVDKKDAIMDSLIKKTK